MANAVMVVTLDPITVRGVYPSNHGLRLVGVNINSGTGVHVCIWADGSITSYSESDVMQELAGGVVLPANMYIAAVNVTNDGSVMFVFKHRSETA